MQALLKSETGAGATLSQGLGASVLEDLRSGGRRGLRNSWHGVTRLWMTASHPKRPASFPF